MYTLMPRMAVKPAGQTMAKGSSSGMRLPSSGGTTPESQPWFQSWWNSWNRFFPWFHPTRIIMFPQYTGLPTPILALRDMRISIQQWCVLDLATKSSLVRGELEARGFSSLNNSTRGQVVYDMVARIDALCHQYVRFFQLPVWQGPMFGGGFRNDILPAMGTAPGGQALPVQSTRAYGNGNYVRGAEAWAYDTVLSNWWLTPADFLRQMNITCDQWNFAPDSWRQLMIRGALESRHISLSGSLLSDTVRNINAYCGARVQIQRGVVKLLPSKAVGMFGANLPRY